MKAQVNMLKFRCLFIIVISCISVSSIFSYDKKNQNRIDYSSFAKYWEQGHFRNEYIKRAEKRYNDYLVKTQFDEKFELNIKEQTLGYGSSSAGNILVIINQKLYNPMTMEDIAVYKSDLEAEGNYVRIVTSTNTNDPAVLRDFLYQEWVTNSIDGAFLIGGLPIAWYEMPIFNDQGDTTAWDVFPCDLYFMDVDGQWLDEVRDNGIPDNHAGNLEMDIWIGRLYTPTMTFHNAYESQLLKTYLNKLHQYREGTLRLKNQGFSYVQKDWAGFHMENEVFKLYNDVTFINDGINGKVTRSDYRKRIKATTNNKYEWMYLACHSGPRDHYFDDGLFNSEEIEPLDVQIHFYLNFNCSAAAFQEDDCLCSWYVMQEPYGLLSVGSTKGGSMLDQYDYYEPLGQGYTFGDAFKYWGIRHYERRDWHYGVVMIGDPTLKLSRFMANPGPRFCYAISPERDARIDSLTPVFIWTKTDSADQYLVEVTSSGNIVWMSNFVTDTLVQMPDNFLKPGSFYRWQVKAYSADVCIDFTQERKFVVKDTTSNYISDMEPAYYHQDWGNLGFDVTCEGNTLSIAGQEYERGLGTHANSIIRYQLEGKYERFTAEIGHDDESNGGDGVTFEVKLDGHTIYGPSKIFMWGTPAEYIDLNVTGGDELELLVHCVGDINYDHADWANARIRKPPTSVKYYESENLLAQNITLRGNYPNPFNSNTTISFTVLYNSVISLNIYNALGQKVKTLINNRRLHGSQTVCWNGTDDHGRAVTSGVYVFIISTEKEHKMGKILLLR